MPAAPCSLILQLCTGKQKKTETAAGARQDEEGPTKQQSKQRVGSHSQAGPSGRSDKEAKADTEKFDAVKGRKWNMGSGSRPGKSCKLLTTFFFGYQGRDLQISRKFMCLNL